MAPTAIWYVSPLSPRHILLTHNVEPPFTPHVEAPNFKLMGAQLFDIMHSFRRDDATDYFHTAEKENIDEHGVARG